jgi:hypothetical protein
MARLVVAALVAFLVPLSAGAQALNLFHDPTNTGNDPGSPGTIVIGGPTTAINLFYTGGTLAPTVGQECIGGTGHEICGVDWLIVATGGVSIVTGSFVADGDWVVNDTSTTQIAGNGGNPLTGFLQDKIGTFLVTASAPGTLELTGKNYVNSSLQLVSYPPSPPKVLAAAGGADFDGDGTADATDSCDTIANTVDADGDGVNDACDTCLGRTNAIFGGSTTNRTRVSGQLDDDGDGRGNQCDFNYDNTGPVILSTDFNQMKPSVGKLMTASNCGLAPTNNQRCGEFDHDGVGPAVSSADFNLAKGAIGKTEATTYPKCAACNPPFSNTLAIGATLGRPICEGPACVY